VKHGMGATVRRGDRPQSAAQLRFSARFDEATSAAMPARAGGVQRRPHDLASA